jgi:hypothetical protein
MLITIFGKKGCKKCSLLENRLNDLLPIYKFEIIKYDLSSEKDIVDFCEMGCLNISRIPSFYISSNNKPLSPIQINSYSLSTVLGFQTDYEKGGTITPNMLKQILEEAKKQLKG